MTTTTESEKRVLATPTEEGAYKFKGMLISHGDWIDGVDFFEFCHAIVFWNQTTMRLNATVTKRSGEYFSDRLDTFRGEWIHA